MTVSVASALIDSGLKKDGLNLSDWLINLASGTSALCKKHKQLDLEAILQYVVQSLLARDSGLSLTVLKELISRMALVEPLEDLSDAQLECMAGHRQLRHEAIMTQAQKEQQTKPITRRTLARLAGTLGLDLLKQNLAQPS